MAKIYLTDDEWLAVKLRDLMTIDIECGRLSMGYLPKLSESEKDAAHNIRKYCKKNIAELLKRCEYFADISAKEDEEEAKSHKVSYITKATLGALCVFAGEQAETVLAELQRLGICKTIQTALKTGKHLLWV